MCLTASGPAFTVQGFYWGEMTFQGLAFFIMCFCGMVSVTWVGERGLGFFDCSSAPDTTS
jgi:hypothetical protein